MFRLRKVLLKDKLAMASLVFLIILYLCTIFAGFVSPNGKNRSAYDSKYARPQMLHFVDQEGKFHIVPFIYEVEKQYDENYNTVTVVDKSKRYPLRLFVHGDEYKFLGIFPTDMHLFGVKGDERFFPLGTDYLGRCLFSRILFGARISLSISMFAVIEALVLGSTIGTSAGYFGGWIDFSIQRIIEFILSFPQIPVWMALAAAVPSSWPSTNVYLAIAMLFAFILWAQLARQVRGRILSLKEKDFVSAAKSIGTNNSRIIFRHLIPLTTSHLIVMGSLFIPRMIIAEATLGFLGLGIKPPMTSWGVLMKRAQSINVLFEAPWVLIPGVFVILTCMAYNFLGEAMRDAFDPHSYLSEA